MDPGLLTHLWNGATGSTAPGVMPLNNTSPAPAPTPTPTMPQGFPSFPGFPTNAGHRFGFPAPAPTPAPAPQPVPPATAPAPTPAPMDQTGALNNFANSGGMQFLLQQGQNAISGQNAAGGVLNSGATGKALEQYGQGLASQYLNQYMDQLFKLSNLGLGSASAISGSGGVGQSQSQNSGNSGSQSIGTGTSSSTGTSQGGSTSFGSTDSSGSSKKGLVPDLASFASVPH
jgi:hypothetical protein